MREIYLESGINMGSTGGAAAWAFDEEHWGVCVQGPTVEEAVANWTRRFGPAAVAELIHGDEQAFARDHRAADDDESALTMAILKEQRGRAIGLLDRLDDVTLDHDDPERVMPSWARWQTIRQTLWHLCDTESRYYLPRTGLPARARAGDLRSELLQSHRHIVAVLSTMPPDLVHREDGEVWTSTKLLRRLAWHERGELDAVDALLARWRPRIPS
ncbi:MAG: hypothetical protein KIT69_08500 [Propionibacteriaceae bacterium]|nr:hypothetical protein [Propionibacteriaceae bacterium]